MRVFAGIENGLNQLLGNGIGYARIRRLNCELAEPIGSLVGP